MRFVTGLMVLTCWSSAAAAQSLEVQVENCRSAKGNLRVAVMDERKTLIAKRDVPAAPGTVGIRFEGLAPGDYAVKVFHDEDGDGEMDKNFMGLPKEGFAFSNRAKVRFGPPSFGAMRVSVTQDAPALTSAVLSYW